MDPVYELNPQVNLVVNIGNELTIAKPWRVILR
jgi:hypothetical protein